MLRNINKKAQSTAEYVIVLGLIVAAVMAMQTYIKRGFNGRIRDAVDFVDQGGQDTNVVQFQSGMASQYEPYYLSSNFKNKRASDETEEMITGGSVTRTLNNEGEKSQRKGTQRIGAEDETAPVAVAEPADF